MAHCRGTRMNAHDRAAWLAARKTGIGGSDIAAILGLSPYRTAVDVFLDKTGQTPDHEPNEAMFWGTVLEDVVAKHYQDTTGNKVQRIREMMRHPQHDWMLANIDRAIVIPGSRARFDGGKLLGASGILECKTASAYKAGEWGRDGDDDAIPTDYAAQIMWYLAITGLEWADAAVLIGGQRYLVKRIERDDDTIKGMIERAEAFWFKHVVEGITPEPTNGDDAFKLFPTDAGHSIEANPKTLELLGRAQELKAQIAALEEELEGDKKKGTAGVLGSLKAYMRDASAIVLGNTTLATWKAAKGSNRIDWQAIAHAAGATPEQIAAHTTTTPGSRRFLIK